MISRGAVYLRNRGSAKGRDANHNNILASERAYCARLNLTWQMSL